MNETMRDVFISELTNEMSYDRNIFFLTGDFGAPTLDVLRERGSNWFLNVGVAEQNLINIASGMALEGLKVFVYGISPFVTMRAYEQIRINLSMLSQARPMNVNIIGVGAGYSYGVSGPTHHCLEDLSIMRTLPNIHLISPSDNNIVRQCLRYCLQNEGPKYIRLDGKPLPDIHGRSGCNITDGFRELLVGEGVCVVGTGFMVHTALEAARRMSNVGHRVGVVDLFMLRPLGRASLRDCLKKYPHVITIEEGFAGKGGLDSLVTDLLTKEGVIGDVKTTVSSIGVRDYYCFQVGTREYLHSHTCIGVDSLVEEIELSFRSLS